MEFGKIALYGLGLSFLSLILHNAIYWLFGFEEPIFFILTFIFLFGFITLGSYSLFMYGLKKIS